MLKHRAFISFDYDNDAGLKVMLAGQAKHPDTPFDIADFSIEETILSNWRDNARRRIQTSDVVVVLCGEHTNTAQGVSVELSIARKEGIPYFLLWGYPDKRCVAPQTALPSDKIYRWTWENLKELLNGSR